MDSEKSYKLYRFTSGYLKFQYDNLGMTWEKAYELTKKRWRNINNFIENFWTKYPEQYPPKHLENWMMELFNVSVEDLKKAVAMDAEEYDKCLPLQPAPLYYLEYVKFFPISRLIPEGLSIDEAIEFVNDIPFTENIRARWMNLGMSEIHFQKNRKYYFTYFRPSLTMEQDAAIFGGYSERIQQYVQIDGKKVSMILS